MSKRGCDSKSMFPLKGYHTQPTREGKTLHN